MAETIRASGLIMFSRLIHPLLRNLLRSLGIFVRSGFSVLRLTSASIDASVFSREVLSPLKSPLSSAHHRKRADWNLSMNATWRSLSELSNVS